MINLKRFLLHETQNLSLLNLRGDDFAFRVHQIKVFYSLQKQLLIKIETFQAQRKAIKPKSESSNSPIILDNFSQTKEIHILLKQTFKIVSVDLHHLLCSIPNVPDLTTPAGKDSRDNVVIEHYGKDLQPTDTLSHWEIAQRLNWIETSQAVAMSQSRSVIYQNEGAKLLRILINFMLDQHLLNHYQEITVPYMVKESALWGSAQFPKMQPDCYQIAKHDLFLIPTAEVPLVNFYRDEILLNHQLPIKLCAYSRCFRRESGAAGKETRGIIRLHEFHKVELVQITAPDNGATALENMLADSTILLKMLKIPYRVVQICTGDLSFSSSKTYDVEVWMPSQNKYLEISSLSNTTDFQSTYLKIRTQESKQATKQFVSTLNGSALAVDRLIACLLEHYYDVSKNVFCWPLVLEKYLHN